MTASISSRAFCFAAARESGGTNFRPEADARRRSFIKAAFSSQAGTGTVRAEHLIMFVGPDPGCRRNA